MKTRMILAFLAVFFASFGLCLAGEPQLDGLRPLDALRASRVADAVEAARDYGEQGGG